MALANIGATRQHKGRPDPIVVFAEMGSLNPVFIMPDALDDRAAEIAAKLVASFTGSAGQLCTCPGVVVIARSPASDPFIAAIATDAPAQLPEPTQLPVLDLNNPQSVVSWMLQNPLRFEYNAEMFA